MLSETENYDQIEAFVPLSGDGGLKHEPDYRVISADDHKGKLDASFSLRAECSGKGNGRTYKITITSIDDSGNSAIATSKVLVPHDKGKRK